MIDRIYTDKSECCACTACLNSCPVSAIKMVKDEYQFDYPQIDNNVCIECGKCLKVCPLKKDKKISKQETYVAQAKNVTLSESASGGMFASFAKRILEVGGIVYGCSLCIQNNALYAKHIRVSEEKKLLLLLGSKYIQSDMGSTFRNVKEDVEKNKTVLFSGTPCQVAGLREFLGKNYSNLFLIDIICHGVPSNKMFQDYINLEEKKHHGKIIDYKFRDKSEGWVLHGRMVIENQSGKQRTVYFNPEKSSYYQMFLNAYTYRDSCYCCPYASNNRSGDITIGDYWCVDLVHPEILVKNGGEFEEKNGISCLIVNNTQGERLLKSYGDRLLYKKSSYAKVAKYNRQLVNPSSLPPERDIVFAKYSQGYKRVDRWFRRKTIPVIAKRKICAMVPSQIKKIIKNR